MAKGNGCCRSLNVPAIGFRERLHVLGWRTRDRAAQRMVGSVKG